jgi:hypothetical protein
MLIIVFLWQLFIYFFVIADGGETKSSKKDKIRYTYRTTEEVVEEISKGGVHKMAREYRYGI